jgi:hypothetical protein
MVRIKTAGAFSMWCFVNFRNILKGVAPKTVTFELPFNKNGERKKPPLDK